MLINFTSVTRTFNVRGRARKGLMRENMALVMCVFVCFCGCVKAKRKEEEGIC